MRQLIKIFLVGALAAIVFSGIVKAQDGVDHQIQGNNISNDELINQKITQNCSIIKASIQQLQRNDHLLRVNRGSIYENFKTRMISRFNSRLVYNDYEKSTDFINMGNSYSDNLNIFRETFQNYDKEMDKLKDIDCSNQPRDFYNQLLIVRSERNKLHDIEVSLREQLSDYRKSTESLIAEISPSTNPAPVLNPIDGYGVSN